MRGLSVAILVVSLFVSSDAWASWTSVKRYLQDDVEVVSETDDRLVLRHPDLARVIVISNQPSAAVDILTKLQRRRGSNPYRVWLATRRFVTDKSLPRARWGVVFKTPFLRIIRLPRVP